MSILSRNAVRASVLVVAGCLARPAAADPVVITSGSVEVQILSSLARMSIAGEDFRLQVGLDAFRSALALECVPCAPGSTVGFGGTLVFPRGSGSAFVDGILHAYLRRRHDGHVHDTVRAGHGHEHDAFLGSVFFLRHGQRLHERSVQRAERPGIHKITRGRRNRRRPSSTTGVKAGRSSRPRICGKLRRNIPRAGAGDGCARRPGRSDPCGAPGIPAVGAFAEARRNSAPNQPHQVLRVTSPVYRDLMLRDRCRRGLLA